MTKIILAHELLEQGISQTCVAERLGVARRTVIRWTQAIAVHGSLEAFLEHYQQAKSGPRKKRKRDQVLKQRIWALREKYRHCCGQKLQYFLKQDYGLEVGVTTIYKVLAEKYQLRSRGQKNQPRGPLPSAQAPRQVVHLCLRHWRRQMDTVDFGQVFAFTAIDIFSKESAVLLRPGLEAADGQAFLHACTPYGVLVCPPVLVVSWISSKPTAGANSKALSFRMYPSPAPPIASPHPTRKTSRAS